MTQLNPPIWVEVVGRGKALCVAWLDYGWDHDTLWGCFIRDTREFWWVPNKLIRADVNFSLGFLDKEVKNA